MISFNEKNFANVSEVKSLKDFSQKDIHNFFNYRGTELYDKIEQDSDLPKGTKISSVKKGSWNKTEVTKYLKGLTVISPINSREYPVTPLIDIASETSEFEKEFDLPVKIHNGYLEFPEFDYYALMYFILPKYHTSESTWHYKFYIYGNNYPKPVISIPTNSKDWEEILRAIGEFLVNLRLFLGNIYKVYLCPSKEGVEEEKWFSRIGWKIASFIPTISAFIYNKIVNPAVKNRIEMSWGKTLRANYSSGLQKKLVTHADQNYKDKLIVANIGNHSYFLALTSYPEIRNLLTNKKFLEDNNIKPDRLRCEMDYWAKAAAENKDVICYCDTDPIPAVAHEIGHFLEEHKDKLGTIQRASHGGVFSEDFIDFSRFILSMGGAVNPLFEVAGQITTLLLNTPTLCSEFYASYYGLELIKKVGGTEEDIKNAKYALRVAYSSYVNGAITDASNSFKGRIAGEILKAGIKAKNK